MSLRRLAAAVAALALAMLTVAAAEAAGTVRLTEPGTLDLWEAGVVVPDGPSIDGPRDLLARIEDGVPATTIAQPDEVPTAVWIAVEVTNASDTERWLMDLRQAYIGRVDVWTFQGSTLVAHRSAGIEMDGPEARPRFALGYELPVYLPPGTVRTVVLYVEPIFFLGVAPVLQTLEEAHTESAWRRLVFPLLLGAYLGIAALHVILYQRFGDIGNLLFAAVVVTVFADWFLWLGGVQDLGFAVDVGQAIDLATITWFTATFFILVFLINFFTGDDRPFKWQVAGQAIFWIFAISHGFSQSPLWQLIYLNLYFLLSATLIYTAGFLAVRRGLPGARLALVAYTFGLASELSAYLGLLLPWLGDFTDWMRSTLGLFDVTTLVSQILVNGLFSMALWERLGSRVRQKEAEARAERAKTVHLAQLCHDIRSPLHAVQSVFGAMLTQAPLALGDPRHVAAMQSSVRSIVGALDDMVDLAKTGRPPSGRRGPVDLRALAADAAAVARADLADRPVDLRVDIAPGLPAVVAGDEVAIRRVLGNLLTNAVRATRRGVIALSIGPANLDRVHVEIADSGPGLSEHRLAELFGPDAARNLAEEGFGLTVAHRLVKAMDGLLGADSKLGVGTTVWFEIPAPALPEGMPAELPPPDAPVYGLRLLLVEDDDLTAIATTALLAADAHEVTRARTAREAVDLAERLPFDLILMDLRLGGGRSGLQAIREIRRLADPVRAAVPIIASSGDRDLAETARRSAPDLRKVLIKPYDAVTLRRAIAEVCGLQPPTGDRDTEVARPSAAFLEDLAAIMPADGLRRLIETGREQILAQRAELERAAEKGRLARARHAAHRLAGSAATLGFEPLTTAAKHAESAAGQGDRAALGAALPAVQTAAAEAAETLDRWLAAPGAVPAAVAAADEPERA